MDKKPSGTGACRCLLLACLVSIPLLTGCSHVYEGSSVGSTFREANDLFRLGSYEVSLNKYQEMIEKDPEVADRALFEMGIIYAYPGNEHRDYEKSLRCFQNILKDYPASRYRQDSAEMISHIENAIIKEEKIIAQQREIAALEREVKNGKSEVVTQQTQIAALEEAARNRENELVTLKNRIEMLEQEHRDTVFPLQKRQVSKILIEKGERRLSLISQDKVLKRYKIALGGNPYGPKERKGDGKTPEGTYIIDSRNKDSRYHLSLHISYPNKKDRERAKEMGVSPGGNIMIHGLKNGFSWVGDLHAEVDWTEGCVAVTDEEIEEIAALVSNGTIVEIKP